MFGARFVPDGFAGPSAETDWLGVFGDPPGDIPNDLFERAGDDGNDGNQDDRDADEGERA